MIRPTVMLKNSPQREKLPQAEGHQLCRTVIVLTPVLTAAESFAQEDLPHEEERWSGPLPKVTRSLRDTTTDVGPGHPRCVEESWCPLAARPVGKPHSSGNCGDRGANRRTPKGLSEQTLPHYVRAVKQFSRWLHRERRTAEEALIGMKGYSAETDRRHQRRERTGVSKPPSPLPIPLPNRADLTVIRWTLVDSRAGPPRDGNPLNRKGKPIQSGRNEHMRL